MAITIKDRGDKWRVVIQQEEWEFDKRKTLDENLKKILDMKEKDGRINNGN